MPVLTAAILVASLLLAALVYLLLTAKKREKKRIDKFLNKWESLAENAIAAYVALDNPTRFFSDQNRKDYLMYYSNLPTAFGKLREPKDKEQRSRLDRINEAIKNINEIGTLQVDCNVAFFNSKTLTLPEEYEFIHNPTRFVGHHEVESFKDKWRALAEQFSSLSNKDKYSDIGCYEVLNKVSKAINSKKDELQEQRQIDNESYCKNELAFQETYFDSIFDYPLDPQQRKAVVTQEDNTLVVSSAGSGKTSTIVGKVKYLVEQKMVAPEDILVVTYTRKAAAELRERMGVDGITCSTFHKHAMDTIGLITGSKPTIVDETVLLNIFESLIDKDPAFLSAFNKYETEWVNLAKDDHKYKTAVQHASDMQKYGLRSPYKDGSGQRKIMKSKQELMISVYLTHLGVDFRYEEPYAFDTSTATRRQYKPDFVIHYRVKEMDMYGREFLVNKVLYYEHFGVDIFGHVPRWFGDGLEGGWEKAQQNYSEGISWKRNIHSTYNTALMETTSADFDLHPDMEDFLEQLLHQHGVPTRRISEEEKRAKLLEADSRIDSSLFSLIKGFITLMKANNKSFNEVMAAIKPKDDNKERNIAVLTQIIKPVFDRYQKYLLDNNEYDFTDTLIKAASLCEVKNPYNYRYILVDEFQDISMDKYLYLKSLRKKDPYTVLFCVGDDWQSIYRFSGSDMTLFYDFAKFFGYKEECKIETTHRFGQPLLNASSVFILTNPEQKVKEVKTTLAGNTNIRFIPYSENNELKVVKEIVSNIPIEESIYILGRYGFNADSICANTQHIDSLAQREIVIGERRIPFLTVHSAKGLEADHVIILDCDSGTYGFPSLIADDPILEYVLSGADAFENAEERRVFYVGITRARRCTYCLFNRESPSPFLSEFGEYSKYQGSTEAICPRCHRGYVRIVKSGFTKYGDPYITVNCTNNACDYFETVYKDAVYKYQPRAVVRVWPLSSFIKKIGVTKTEIDYRNRLYNLIKIPDLQYAPILIAPNIIVGDLLKENLSRNPEDYEVAAINYFDKLCFILKKRESDVFISNADLENGIKRAKSFASGNNLQSIDPYSIIGAV